MFTRPPGRFSAIVGLLKSEWNQRDAEGIRSRGNDCQADAVHGNRSFFRQEWSQLLRRPDRTYRAVAVTTVRSIVAHGINMTENEVAVQPVAKRKSTLKVHTATGLDGPYCRSVKRFGHGREINNGIPDRFHGQAYAVAGDGSAWFNGKILCVGYDADRYTATAAAPKVADRAYVSMIPVNTESSPLRNSLIMISFSSAAFPFR